MTKKMGPLPVWAWGLIMGVGVYFFYERAKGASNSSTSTGATSDQIDPATGLSYAAEESAALNAQAAANTPTTGNLGSTSTTPDFSGIESLLTFIQGIDPNFGTGNTGVGTPPVPGGTTPPLTGSTPPPTKPTAHTQIPSPGKARADLRSRLGLTPGEGAGSFVAALLAEGYKRGTGKNKNKLTKKGQPTYRTTTGKGGTYVHLVPPPKPKPSTKKKPPARTKTGGAGVSR